MNIQEKINDEMRSINYERKNLIERFEEAKDKMIKLIQKATPTVIFELEHYQVITDIKRYASEIEILDAKLRVYNYLTDETR